jgi:hypothetical protein
MPPEYRSRTLSYRRAQVVGVDSQAEPLQELLQRALGRYKKADDRRQPIDKDGNHRLINDSIHYKKIFVCNFVDFTVGMHQWVLKLDGEATAYSLAQLAPKDKQEQFLEGMLYLGVQDDHVVLIQSKSLRSASLEDHLSWLLVEHGGILPSGARVILSPELPPAKRETAYATNVKSVSLTTTTSGSAPPHTVPSGTKDKVSGELYKVAKTLLAKAREELIGTLSAREAMRVEDFQLIFQIRRKGRSRAVDGSVLDDLAELVRHADDIDFELQSGAGTITSRDIKLSDSRKLAVVNGAPTLTEVARVMNEWLAELIQDRKVRS